MRKPSHTTMRKALAALEKMFDEDTPKELRRARPASRTTGTPLHEKPCTARRKKGQKSALSGVEKLIKKAELKKSLPSFQKGLKRLLGE